MKDGQVKGEGGRIVHSLELCVRTWRVCDRSRIVLSIASTRT